MVLGHLFWNLASLSLAKNPSCKHRHLKVVLGHLFWNLPSLSPAKTQDIELDTRKVVLGDLIPNPSFASLSLQAINIELALNLHFVSLSPAPNPSYKHKRSPSGLETNVETFWFIEYPRWKFLGIAWFAVIFLELLKSLGTYCYVFGCPCWFFGEATQLESFHAVSLNSPETWTVRVSMLNLLLGVHCFCVNWQGCTIWLSHGNI